MDLIVTSGGLGPTADDLTAEVVGRFAGREMVLDEEMEEKIAEILPTLRAASSSTPRRFARRTESRRSFRRARRCSTRSAQRPASSCPSTGGSSSSCPGRRASCSRCGRRRSKPSRCEAVLDRAPRRTRLDAAHVRHPRVGDRKEPARDLGGGRRPRPGGDHHLPAARRDRDRRALPREARPARRRRCAQARRAPRASALQPGRRDDRLAGGGLPARTSAGPCRVLQRWPARRADDRSPRRLCLHGRRVVTYANEAKTGLSASTRS